MIIAILLMFVTFALGFIISQLFFYKKEVHVTTEDFSYDPDDNPTNEAFAHMMTDLSYALKSINEFNDKVKK